MRNIVFLGTALLVAGLLFQNCAPSGGIPSAGGSGVQAKDQSMNAIAVSGLGAVEPQSTANQKITVSAGKVDCSISSAAELATCLASSASDISIQLSNDLTCNGTDCCPGGKSIINIVGKKNVFFNGNGRAIRRASESLKSCTALAISNSSNVTIKNLNFVEALAVPNCTVAYMEAKNNSCSTIASITSQNLVFDNVSVFHGKGYAVTVTNAQGISWLNSKIHNAGIIGLYIGSFYNNRRSSNVVVQNSIFTRVATNALVLQGVSGATVNYITGNTFLNNHHHGAWSLCGASGTNICNGGQMYIPDATNVQITQNIVGDGFCENCPNVGEFEFPVWGVELGAAASADQAVSKVLIEGNYFYNHGYAAILKNIYTNVTELRVNRNRFNGIYHMYKVVNTPNEWPLEIKDNIFNPLDSYNRLNQKPPYSVQRFSTLGLHFEARLKTDYPLNTLEREYTLSDYPNRSLGAAGGAIYRCFLSNPTRDFLSLDRNCEGAGVLSAIVGFSKEVGTQTLYRCRVADDHFVSADSKCEGTNFEGALGKTN